MTKKPAKKKLAVAVVFGGRSGEHEVSLQSAASVIAALDPRKYDVAPILIDKRGQWWHEPSMLPGHNGRRRRLTPDPSNPGLMKMGGRSNSFDVVFPLVHGTGGEDGCLQGLLETAGVPYVGSGVLGSAVGMDKAVQKKILREEGLPVVPWIDFTNMTWKRRQAGLLKVVTRLLGLPVFVKPANLGSSVGISKAHNLRELVAGIKLALRYDLKVVVEKAVDRAREIECSVIGNDEPLTSVLGEIVPSNEFYDYDAKYIDGKSRALIPAPLPPALAAHIKGMAGRVFTALEAGGLARVDFLVSRGATPRVFVNEINTLPGFTDISMFPKLWAASGLSYNKLLDRLIVLALDRAAKKRRLVRSYEPKRRRGGRT
jgi:D-alanine-D-alanine ligase